MDSQFLHIPKDICEHSWTLHRVVVVQLVKHTGIYICMLEEEAYECCFTCPVWNVKISRSFHSIVTISCVSESVHGMMGPITWQKSWPLNMTTATTAALVSTEPEPRNYLERES